MGEKIVLIDRPELMVTVEEKRNELHLSGKVVYFKGDVERLSSYLKIVFTLKHIHRYVVEENSPGGLSGYPPKGITERFKAKLRQLVDSAKPFIQNAFLSDLKSFAPDLVAGWYNLPTAFKIPPEVEIFENLSHRWELDISEWAYLTQPLKWHPERGILSLHLNLDVETYFWFNRIEEILRAFSQAVNIYFQGNRFSFSPNRDAVVKLFNETSVVIGDKIIEPLFYNLTDQELEHLLFLDEWDGRVDKGWSEGFTNMNARIETSGENPYGVVLFSFRYPKTEGVRRTFLETGNEWHILSTLSLLTSLFPSNLTVNFLGYDPAVGFRQQKLMGQDAQRVLVEALEQYLL